MIKKTHLSWTIAAAVVIVLLAAMPLAANSNVTYFECSSNVEYEVLVPPDITVLPSGNIHLRGMVQRYRAESPTEPRMVGYNTVEVNANWGVSGLGPMWGTFSLASDLGGLWEGTWEGMATPAGVEYHAAGSGTGVYRGMKVWIDKMPDSCHGRILDHE